MATRADVMAIDIDLRTGKAKAAMDGFVRHQKQSAGKLDRTFKGVQGSVNSLRNVLFAGGAASLVVGGIASLDRFFTKATQIQEVSAGFETLTARIGSTSDRMLTQLRPAARGLVTDMELMKQANNAIILGLPVTAKSMGELTDIAVTLGRALGVDATRAIESMITGIGRQSRLMLDNIGIIVKVEEANQRYADSLGISASQLTDSQKKLAFYEEALRKGREATENLASSTTTLADIWNQSWTAIKNKTDTLIGRFNRMAGTGIAAQLAMLDAGLRQLLGTTSGVGFGGTGGRPPVFLGDLFTPRPLSSIQPPSLAPLGGNAPIPLGGAPLGGGNPFGPDLSMTGPLADPETFRTTVDLFGLAANKLDTLENAWARNTLAIGEMNASFVDLGGNIEAITERAATLGPVMEMMAGAFAQAGAAQLFAAIAGEKSNISFKKVIAQLAQSALAQSLYELAIGFAALTPWGRALYGDPALHFKSAAVFGTAGVALGLASRGAGGGGAGGGLQGDVGVPGGSFAGSSLTPAPRRQEITIYVEGQGFIQNTTEFARMLSDEITRQNGAGGLG